MARPARRNKKILLFVDEKGEAGRAPFYIGVAVCRATIAARIDTHIAQGLPLDMGEIHAADMRPEEVCALLDRLQQAPDRAQMVLLNQVFTRFSNRPAPEIYAECVLLAIASALTRYKKTVAQRELINNVEVYIDHTDLCLTEAFRNAMDDKLRRATGHLKAINRYTTADSCAMRLLQLADLVTAVRALVPDRIGRVDLEGRFGIALA